MVEKKGEINNNLRLVPPLEIATFLPRIIDIPL